MLFIAELNSFFSSNEKKLLMSSPNKRQSRYFFIYAKQSWTTIRVTNSDDFFRIQ